MCCLFGIIDYNKTLSIKNKEKILKVLSRECEARGTDATGIAYIKNNGVMKIYKRALPAHKMRLKLYNDNPKVIMGHTRLTTQGNEKYNYNNHPFYSQKLGFALAHNGVIYNDDILRKTEKLPQTKIETDSYIAVQLIENKKALNLNSIKYMAEKVEGSFSFTILGNDNTLCIVKGDNPIAIADFKDFYIYASTRDILDKALKKLKLKPHTYIIINEGEILTFNPNGNITSSTFEYFYYYTSFYHSYGYRNAYTKNTKSKEPYDPDTEYIQDLISYGKLIGVDEDTISELYLSGFSPMEIEEMLYEAETNDCGSVLNSYLNEI